MSFLLLQSMSTGSTEAFSYLGSILNFALLALPVFAGTYPPPCSSSFWHCPTPPQCTFMWGYPTFVARGGEDGQ
jgi:hypothetical protein